MPDLLLGGSAVTVEAGAGSGQPGQYAQPVKPEEIPPSYQSAVSTERTFVLVAMAAKDWKVTPRRIRHLLSTERLEVLQQANSYWIVPPSLPLYFRGAGNGFKTISGASSRTRTGRGMIQLDSLTRGRQFVNRVKLGITSCAFNSLSSLCNQYKQRACELMRYTLCVIEGAARWNSFRNSLPVSGGCAALASRGALAPQRHEASPLMLI